jgi:hypothetical protein
MLVGGFRSAIREGRPSVFASALVNSEPADREFAG